MTDVLTKEQRHKNMSAIRSKNTSPEIYFRKLLFNKGYRYSVNAKTILGHPDIYLRKYNTAIFVHGCFWHRHEGCKYANEPKSRVEFWEAKFDANKRRDELVYEQLKRKKVKQLIIWECTIKKMKKDPLYAEEIIAFVEEFLGSECLKMEL